MITYLGFLVSTLVLELAVVMVARRWQPSLRPLPVLATCLCLNLLTHPLATVAHVAGTIPILPLEAAVILIEANGYKQIARVSLVASISLSLVANVASMLVGLVAFVFVP